MNTGIIKALEDAKEKFKSAEDLESVEWVTKELNGYSLDDEVPEYRILNAQTKRGCRDSLGRELIPVLVKDNENINHDFDKLHLRDSLYKIQEGIFLGRSSGVNAQQFTGKELDVISKHIVVPDGYHISSIIKEYDVSDLEAILLEAHRRLIMKLQDVS